MEDKSAAQFSAAAPTVATDDTSARRAWPHQTAALRWLREDFVRNLLATLEHLVGGKWHLRLAGAALSTRAEFISSAEEKTCCYAITSRGPDPADGAAGGIVGWIEATPSIAFPILNCLLGGSSDDQFIPQRPLTAIERRLLLRLAEMAAGALAASWISSPAPALEICGEQGDIGADDGPARVLTASFDFGLNRQAGTLRVSLDHGLLPPLSSPWSPPTQKDSVLEISAVLADSEIDPRELDSLKAGDIVTTSVPVDGEVIIRVAGIPKFVGKLGVSNGRRAVTIVRRMNEKT